MNVKRIVSAAVGSRLGAISLRRARRTIKSCKAAINLERHVKLFKNGRNQAVRIPREFELPGSEAILRKEGERLTLEPLPQKSLLAVLATLAPLDEEFPATTCSSPLRPLHSGSSSSPTMKTSSARLKALPARTGCVRRIK